MRGLGLSLAFMVIPAFAAATPTLPHPGEAPGLGALSDKVTGVLSDPNRAGQVSQSASRPCPLAIGLPAPDKAAVERRIADQSGPPRPHRPCRTPNTYIRFTGQPPRLIALI